MAASKLSQNMTAVLNSELDNLEDLETEPALETDAELIAELDAELDIEIDLKMPIESDYRSGELSQYIHDIEQYKLISQDEEIELAKLICAGKESTDPAIIAAGLQAREKFINANYRLVIAIAKNYRNSCSPAITFLDLIQVGNMGLMKSVDRFDYTKGLKFSTYATWWIRQHIKRDILNNAHTIRVPVHIQEWLSKITRLEHQHGDLTPIELAELLGLSEHKVMKLLHVRDDMKMVYLDRDIPTADDSLTPLLEMIPSEILPPDLAHKLEERDQYLYDLMDSKLTDREFYILAKRFGLVDDKPATLEMVGQELGITRERVRQVEEKALRKLKTDKIRTQLKEVFGIR